MKLTMYFDGAANPNPGPMGIGVVIEDADGKVVKELSERLESDKGTNNIAEYTALIRGLEEATKLGATSLTIKGDSNLIIQQLLGRFRVREPHLRPLHEKAVQLANAIREVAIQWIPREENKRADALSYAPVATQRNEPSGPKIGTKPGPREHSILCPKCGKPSKLSIQTFSDGREAIRQQCPEHGFLGYTPDVEPFRTLARKGT